MSHERRATFAKVLIENGEEAKTMYSFRLERAHWIFGILASLGAIAVSRVVRRGAVYASGQDVAGIAFNKQLEQFHEEAQPAIRELIDERILVSETRHAAEVAVADRVEALAYAEKIAEIAQTLARLDERLAAIEKRLNRMEVSR